jgi:hypothetical protein
MTIWQPDPGEAFLARVPVTFATGSAMRVRGMRWFRDTERNDIQSELEGWPEGPTYASRSTGRATTLTVLKTAAIAAAVLTWGILSAQGGSVGPSASKSGSKTSDDHADEVEDFPVLWAAPGTIARTLPWQLDPARLNQKHYRTHMIVTDRRLVIVDLPFHEWDRTLIDDEVLWETPRSTIRAVERRDFEDGDDVKIVFTDGSWCRLETRARHHLLRYLVDRREPLPLESLTPAQRKTAEAFASAHAPDAGPPIVTRSECGCYLVEVLAPSAVDSFHGHSEEDMLMDADGAEVNLGQYHLEDWSPEAQHEMRSLPAKMRPPSGISPDPN